MKRPWVAVLLSACSAPAAVTNQPEPAPPVSTGSPCPAERVAYEPAPANRVLVQLPEVPELPQQPIKRGEAYTVWGASYSLRSRVHRADLPPGPITIEGYIVKTNLPDAPRCAVHRTGKADPPDCHSPVPAFWIGDTPKAAVDESIKVLGWASNYAQIFEAIRLFDSGKAAAGYTDEFWGVELPNPLPAPGAKVRVTGVYGRSFALSSSGTEADPFMGLLTYRSLEQLEPAAEVATLPGVSRAKR